MKHDPYRAFPSVLRVLPFFAFTFAFALGAGALPACAASPDADGTGESSSALAALTPDEVLGSIQYGETVAIDYTSTPRYRAYTFTGQKGDWLDVSVTSSTGSVDAFVTDDQFRSVRRGTQAVLPRTGTYYIAVRTDDLSPGTISVKFLRHVLAAGETAPAAAD